MNNEEYIAQIKADRATIKKYLEKQLQLLSEISTSTTDQNLAELSFAMCTIVQTIHQLFLK